MNTLFKPVFLVLFILAVFIGLPAFAQTITIGTVDPGPYAPGSQITVPVHIDDATGCINPSNGFFLYLSDDTGNLSALNNIQVVTNSFYISYINATIPTGITAGTGYRVMIKSTFPNLTSAPSNSFTINTSLGIAPLAKIDAPAINTGNPEVFGNCAGNGTYSFSFINSSTAGATTSATFLNEKTQTIEKTLSPLGANGSFTANVSNYSIFVKAVSPTGIVSTKGYTLINNIVNNAIGATGGGSACLPSGQKGTTLIFNVDISSPNGIQFNFPGDTYQFVWGDGGATTLTYCQIKALGGQVPHLYTTSSCGGLKNAFKVTLSVINPFCGTVGTDVSTSAIVLKEPKSGLTFPQVACTNSPVTFINTSDPGQDPNNTTADCTNPNALYSWYVDGALVKVNVPLSQNFVYTFNSNGSHTVSLEFQSNSSGATCTIPIKDTTICVQDPPQPSFKIAGATNNTLTICPGTVFSPTNTSVTDITCATYSNNWVLTGPGGANFQGGTYGGSYEPQYKLTVPGVYKLRLDISTPSCGNFSSTTSTIVVNNAPVAQLSSNFSICGQGLVLTFDNTTNSKTYTVLTGTNQTQPGTYTWTVTPPAGGTYSFANGTTANDQYPQILFDTFGTYKVSVTQTNTCGTTTASQSISFVQSPTITAGADQTICRGSTASLLGTVTGPAPNSIKWTSSGTGTFSSSTTLASVYTPSAADKTAGSVVLTLTGFTNNPPPCTDPTSSLTLTISPPGNITSAAAKTICTGNAVNYSPTADIAGSTFAWTAALTSGTATGFANGSGANINDVITNTSATVNAVITYTITPTGPGPNFCPGNSFQFKVTVTPNPIVTATPAALVICSGQPVSISLSSNLPVVGYTWTATVLSGTITGYNNQPTPLLTNNIQDVLVNSSLNTLGKIEYDITPISTNQCAGIPSKIIISVQPAPQQADPGKPDEVCNTTSYKLNGNDPSPGTGKWTVSPQIGVSFVNDTDPKTVVNGLVPGTTYTFTWTITATANCSTTKSVSITIDRPTLPGVTNGSTAVCAGNNSGQVTLVGSDGSILNWESSVDNGATWVPIANTSTSQAFFNLTQTTQYRAVVQSGKCNILSSTISTITVNQPPITADAGQPTTLCNQSSYALQGNNPGGFAGIWTVQSGQAGVTFANASQYNTTVSGLIGGGQPYTLRWTIKGVLPCIDSYADVTITNLAAITNTIPASTAICANQTTTITGSVPTGGTGSYTYVWEVSADDVTWVLIPNETNKDLTVSPLQTTWYRRTVLSGICSTISTEEKVIVQQAIGNNVIVATNTEICINTAPGIINGSTPSGGDGNFIYQWRSSTDGINFTDIPGANTINYTPPVLTVSAQYRRVVTTALCSGANGSSLSNAVNITVDPDAKAIFTAAKQSNCAPFFISSLNITASDDPGTSLYEWYADGNKIGQGLSFPGYTIPLDGMIVTITLKVTSKFGCHNDSYSLPFSTVKQVATSFIADKQATGCSPYTVTFTNTSVPLNGSGYIWSFGDGSQNYIGVSPPPHVFQADQTGKDITYTVTLSSDGCLPNPTSMPITVLPSNPIARISPRATTGCAPFTVTVDNNSPGNNIDYTYYLYDDNNALVEVKTVPTTAPFSFQPLNPSRITTYTMHMETRNACGNVTKSFYYPVTIAPSSITSVMLVSSQNQGKGCAPLDVTFSNLADGGNQYTYSIYDSSNNKLIDNFPAPRADLPYRLNTPGSYYATITASNGCSTVTSPAVALTVYPTPTPAFHADNPAGCKKVTVTFTNDTPDDPIYSAKTYSYVWDFGDGTPPKPTSSIGSVSHSFSSTNSPYTISLTAITPYGCSNTVVMKDYISVNGLPGTKFAAKPDTVTSIPNYHFSFIDQTTGGPLSWQWTFGDGATSTRQNPEHSYADTGKYLVTLTAHNTLTGCDSTFKQTVRITGVPGQLYVPNAFMPNSATTALRTFKAKGSGIASWTMSVFNNWGQLIWETNKLTAKGEPVEGWDGTFNGVPMPQGVYSYEITALFINGTVWKGMTYNNSTPKRAGVVHLIR